jgi:YbbR domain-containing protein
VSESAQLWGLRLLALGIALALWYSVSLEDRESMAERLIEASVSYNRPRGFVVLDPVPSVSVRLRGSSKAIRQLNPFQATVQVDLPRAQLGAVNITLGPDDVQVPEGFEVVSIDPNVIRVDLDREITQRVPVRADLRGKPAPGSEVGEPEILPNQVFVTGPQSLLERVEFLTTRPIQLTARAITFEESVDVVPPADPLIQVVQPSKVNVRVPLTPPEPPAGEAAEEGST